MLCPPDVLGTIPGPRFAKETLEPPIDPTLDTTLEKAKIHEKLGKKDKKQMKPNSTLKPKMNSEAMPNEKIDVWWFLAKSSENMVGPAVLRENLSKSNLGRAKQTFMIMMRMINYQPSLKKRLHLRDWNFEPLPFDTDRVGYAAVTLVSIHLPSISCKLS